MQNYEINKEFHGDVEIIINYGDQGLITCRRKDIMSPELVVTLIEGFKQILLAVMAVDKHRPQKKNVMQLFSQEQFDQC